MWVMRAMGKMTKARRAGNVFSQIRQSPYVYISDLYVIGMAKKYASFVFCKETPVQDETKSVVHIESIVIIFIRLKIFKGYVWWLFEMISKQATVAITVRNIVLEGPQWKMSCIHDICITPSLLFDKRVYIEKRVEH